MRATKLLTSSFFKGCITHLGLLVLLLLLLIGLTSMFSRLTLYDRIDRDSVTALTHSFEILPFTCQESSLNVTGEMVILLNISGEFSEYHIYYFPECLGIERIATVSSFIWNNTEFLVFATQEVEDGLEYVLDGKFQNLRELGGKGLVRTLVVQNLREKGYLDELVRSNVWLFQLATIMSVIVTAATALALLATALWMLEELQRQYGRRRIL